MGFKKGKSALERYLSGLLVSLSVQELKRPEAWGNAFGFGLTFVAFQQSWLAGLAVLVAWIGLRVQLSKRRLRAKDASEAARMSLMPRVARDAIRKGTFDTSVGAETRTVLERCAEMANTILVGSAEVRMFGVVGKEQKKAYAQLGRSTETLMVSAFGLLRGPLLFRRPLDGGELQQLNDVETSLQSLVGEMERLRLAAKTSSAIPFQVTDHLEEIKAREELNQKTL